MLLVTAARRQGDSWTHMAKVEGIAWELCIVQSAKKRFDTQGVVDLSGIVEYYTILAMQLNAAQNPVPKDGLKLPRMPK
jgi:hypothetical protein